MGEKCSVKKDFFPACEKSQNRRSESNKTDGGAVSKRSRPRRQHNGPSNSRHDSSGGLSECQKRGNDPSSIRFHSTGECITCCATTANARLVPCGHMVMCMTCAHRLNPDKCPSCRTQIEDVT